MTLLDTVRQGLAAWPQPRDGQHGVVVPTTCLYSGGGVVHVHVSGGADSFQVHDAGGALTDFENCGGELHNSPRILSSFLRSHGVSVDKQGRIFFPLVEVGGLGTAIAVVANASRAGADHLLEKWRPIARRKFKDIVEDFVSHEFPQRWTKEVSVPGRSSKMHRFDFVVELGQDRQLLLDAVVPDANAISTAVVRHIDVREAHRAHTDQRILFDDRQTWRSSDIALLKIGAPPVPFAGARAAMVHLH